MFVFTNARIFDGEADQPILGASLFVRNGDIVEVSDRPPTPSDGAQFDCRGGTLMPGMIDAHVHAFAFTADPHEADQAPESLLGCWAGYMLGRMLDRGFTTVRDAGGGDFGLAQALERGYIRGPRLYYCGRALCQTGGGFDTRNHRDASKPSRHGLECGCGYYSAFAAVVDGVDAVRRAVRENLRRGASFVKLFGSGDVTTTGSRVEAMEFSDDEIAVIVDESRRHGVYCTAHVHPDAAIARAIRLGVPCLEHGSLISWETAKMAASEGTFIVPTVAVVDAFARRADEVGLQPETRAKLGYVGDRLQEGLAHMRQAGVRIGLGSDLLGRLETDQLNELQLRAAVFSPVEILKQATSNNAAILGETGRLGVLKAGALADLILVDGDPLTDIGLLADEQRITMVMKAGRFEKGGLRPS
jgi:imidazolonepropionase-like amidohydrolase